MNKTRIKRLNKKIDKMFNSKKTIIFPIMGGLALGEQVRKVTDEEAQILISKGMPVPINIALNREKELQELIKNEM